MPNFLVGDRIYPLRLFSEWEHLRDNNPESGIIKILDSHLSKAELEYSENPEFYEGLEEGIPLTFKTEHRKVVGADSPIPFDDYDNRKHNNKKHTKDKKIVDNVEFDDGVSSKMSSETFGNTNWKKLKDDIRSKSKSLFDVKE